MNTSKLTAVAVLVASLSLFACDEQVVPTEQPKGAAPSVAVPNANRRVILSGTQTPPSNAPGEYQHYTWIQVTADVGWLDANTSYGQSIVQYGANNATADVVLTVRNASGVIIGSNTGHAAESWVFPANRTLRVSTNAYVTPTCGSVAQAAATGAAWDAWLGTTQGLVRWGDKGDSDTRSAAQAACAPPPSSTCQDTKANNYGAPLPCTYQPPPPPGSTGGSGPTPPPGTGYPGQYYVPPYSQPGVIGYWQCVTYNANTPYVIQNCTWTTTGYYYDRLASRPMSLSRIAAPDAAARSQSSAYLPSVFVIVSDQVPSDAIAVIERHKTGPLKNVLLVPLKTIRPAVFVAAMQALYDSRDKDGDAPARDISITLRGSIQDQDIPSAARDYGAAFTAQVASAKKGDAAGYGDLPIVEFKLGSRK